MKKFKSLLTLITASFLIYACGNKQDAGQNTMRKHASKSFELVPGYRDTINMTDWDGNKQGRWIIFKRAVLNKGRQAESIRSEEGYYKDNKKTGYWKKYSNEGKITDSTRFINDLAVQN